jgi:hypothetical protein
MKNHQFPFCGKKSESKIYRKTGGGGDDNNCQTLKELMVLVKELGNQLALMGWVIWKFSKL